MHRNDEGPESDDEIEPLERHPEVSREAQCGTCDNDLFAIGSFFACQDATCPRFAVPVNEYGFTDAEWENECERRGVEADARAVR